MSSSIVAVRTLVTDTEALMTRLSLALKSTTGNDELRKEIRDVILELRGRKDTLEQLQALLEGMTR